MQSSAEHTEKIANASRERNLDCKQGPAALSPRSSRVLCDFCGSMSCFALPISRLSRYISGIFPPTDMPTFYDSFLECVERWPQNVALEIQRDDAVESYTYAELRQMSESIARWVTEIGLGPGSRLAILADNHPRWVAAYLGVIAAGCTAVPLDTAFHADQVTKLLKDSGTSVLFADAKHLPLAQRAVAGLRVGLVLTNSPSRDGGAAELRSSLAGAASVSTGPSADLDGIFAAGAGNFRPRASSDSIAALLYTSGTTADPKGVMLSHANLLGEVEAVFGCVHLGPDDAVLGVLPLFHVLSQMANVLLPLVKGARVVYLETLNTTELMRALRERNITAFAVVPQFFYLIHERIFSEVAKRSAITQKIFKALMALNQALRRVGINAGRQLFGRIHATLGEKMRYLATGGSRFDPGIARDFYSLGIDVMQALGLTETAAAVFVNRPGDIVFGSVGKAMKGVEAKIVDLQPQDDDDGGPQAGEI